jgi:hypothetical protein
MMHYLLLFIYQGESLVNAIKILEKGKVVISTNDAPLIMNKWHPDIVSLRL